MHAPSDCAVFRLLLTVVPIGLTGAALAGPLDPPAGPIAPTAKPMGEVEPRIAINATNTPGDADSVFQITQPGSYYLTGNVTGVNGKHGIEIASNFVTVDLAGYTLVGVAGSLSGVFNGGSNAGLAVRNGGVTSWGASGVNFTGGLNHVVEGVSALNNGAIGIRVGSNAVIRGCVAYANVLSGISSNSNALVSECTSRENLEHGISVINGSVVVNCMTRQNGLTGITTGNGCTITGCTAFNNTSDGIVCPTGIVTDSSAASNGGIGISVAGIGAISGCAATSNLLDGIRVTGSCTVSGNTCGGNGVGTSDGANIHAVASDNRIEGNTCVGADRGIDVDAAGNFISRNICSANTTNWDIVAGNICLVVNATTAGAISGNAGGTAPGSTDPNANYTY